MQLSRGYCTGQTQETDYESVTLAWKERHSL